MAAADVFACISVSVGGSSCGSYCASVDALSVRLVVSIVGGVDSDPLIIYFVLNEK